MRKNGMDMHTFSRTNILSFTKAFEQRVIKLSLDFYGSFFFLPKISLLPSSLPIHLLRILVYLNTFVMCEKIHDRAFSF